MNRELARFEVALALCERCYGPEPRHPVRFERGPSARRLLVLGERPPRAGLEAQERLGLDATDAGTVFLRQMIRIADIPPEDVLLATSTMCRPVSRELERAVPASACLRECAAHVRELLGITRPRLLVLLGATAVRSMRAAFPADRAIRTLRFPASVGVSVPAGGTWIHPLYHTTHRARVSRPADVQRRDWREVGRLYQWIAGGERGRGPRSVDTPRHPARNVA